MACCVVMDTELAMTEHPQIRRSGHDFFSPRVVHFEVSTGGTLWVSPDNRTLPSTIIQLRMVIGLFGLPYIMQLH